MLKEFQDFVTQVIIGSFFAMNFIVLIQSHKGFRKIYFELKFLISQKVFFVLSGSQMLKKLVEKSNSSTS